VEEFEAARVMEEPHYILWDETIGKKVLINDNGVVSFVHPDGDDIDIDLNWKRLRSMAKPIVDEQLGKLVMMKQWKKCNMRVDLGVLMLDNTVVRYDKESCGDMTKDESEDMEKCTVAWNRKLDIERRKRAIEKPADGGHSDRRKDRNFLTNLNFEEREQLEKGTNDEDIKPLMAGSSSTKPNPDEEEETVECYHCRQTPCVWVAQEENMRLFDENEHAHMTSEDLPPNNIRRKKLYRQMFLLLNEGTAGVGVRIELPKCVENGTRTMFPSPTFMGFKVS
jgi:hypothetical protein